MADDVEVPCQLRHLNKNVITSADIIFVGDICFFVSRSYKICFLMQHYVPIRTASTLANAGNNSISTIHLVSKLLLI